MCSQSLDRCRLILGLNIQEEIALRSLVWFKNDLRVTDNPALYTAATNGEVVACYCLSVAQWRSHGMGDLRLAFLLRTLRALAASLRTLNIPLLILSAPKFSEIPSALKRLAQTHQIDQLHFIDEYPLDERRRDDAVATVLTGSGVQVERHLGDSMVRPGQLRTGTDTPLTVFTPFYRKWQAPALNHSQAYCPAPKPQQSISIASDTPPSKIDGVDISMADDLWPGGEDVAQDLLHEFVDAHIEGYAQNRDVPSKPGTSRLSAHLAVGAISARQCMRAAKQLTVQVQDAQDSVDRWISELAWRDFYRHIAGCFDHISMGNNFRRDTDRLPWRQAPEELAAWQTGCTGYPLVDAAMRQLNDTGWMHNRLRMVTAMFLTKHLLIDWRAGERYFMSRLVDGDFASNNGGWQWSASTGTDAAPYFRIFSPASQGKRFDAEGVFTKHWLPELVEVPPKYLFEPHLSGPVDYPPPIVEHKFARERALAFFKANREIRENTNAHA